MCESLFNVYDDSEKDLYKIAFLTKGALEYALNGFGLGMNEKELREYLNIFYKKNKDKFKISGSNKKGEEYRAQKTTQLPICSWSFPLHAYSLLPKMSNLLFF